MKPSIFPMTALLAAMALGAGGAAQAATAFELLDVTDSTGGAVGAPPVGVYQTLGYKFTLSQPTQVTSLGIWDRNGDGLALAHDVGLWTSGGSLLATVTVPAGTGATYVASADTGTYAGSGWRFTSLAAPLNLAAGDYVLGAEYTRASTDVGTFDDHLGGVASIQMALGSTFVENRESAPPTNIPNLTFPNFAGSANGVFGPNLQTVPVPAAVWLFGSALAGLIGIGRRKAA